MAARHGLRRVLPRSHRRFRARARGGGRKAGAAYARSRPDEAARHPDRRGARDPDSRRRRHQAAAPGLLRARPRAEGRAHPLRRVQLRAAGARARDRSRAGAAVRPAHAIPLLGVSRVRTRLLGGDALAADARGPARTLRDVLRRLISGEVTEDEALAELRRVQLDALAGRARLDLGRYLRRGIPEVVLATGKSPDEAARLAVAMAGQHGQGLVSRMTEAHRAALASAATHMRVV